MAYILSAQSGNFSSPTTWVGGVVPVAGDYACTLNHRIVLDVDTEAHLCVNRTDWVAGGGTDSSTIAGGFTVPTDATRIIGGDVRYDNGTASARNSSTTSPVYMTSGTLQVRNLVWVAGTNAVVTGNPNLYVIHINSVTGKVSKFTYTGTATVLINTSSTSGTYNTYSVYASGTGFVDLTLGEAVIVQAVAGASSYSSMLLFLNNSTYGYNLALNGNIPNTASVANNGLIQISTSSSGINNQKITINSPTIGLSPLTTPNVYAIYIASTGVSSLTVTSTKLSVYSKAYHSILSTYDNFAFGFTANTIEFFYGYGFSFPISGNVTIGDVYLNSLSSSYPSTALNVAAGAGNVTIGNIILRAITSVLFTVRTSVGISLKNTGSVSVGNISVEAGQLSEVKILEINGNGSLTTNVNIGNIDLRNAFVRAISPNNTPTAFAAALVNITRTTTGTITLGGITAGNNGLYVASDVYAVNLQGFAADNGAVTINGNVECGSNMSALRVGSSLKPVTINGYVKGITSDIGSDFNRPVAVATVGLIKLDAIKQAVNNLVTIMGKFLFNNYSNGVITLVDGNNNNYDLFTVAQTSQIIPAPSDVRLGVNVGSGQGTLVVPQAATVQAGVIYDGSTTGTLNVAQQTDLAAVKAVTDKLHFTQGYERIPDPNNDPYWDNVVIASHCDSLTSFDLKGHTFANYSSLVALSSTAKFTTAIALSGTYANLRSTSADYVLGTANFTIECFFYKSSGSSQIYQRILQMGTNRVTGCLCIVANTGTADECRPFVDIYTTTWTKAAPPIGTVTQDAWHHLAVTRDGDLFRLFIDGVLYSSATLTDYNITADTITIGANSADSEAFSGYIDDLRVTKGVCRYATNFTPPSSPFTTYQLLNGSTMYYVDSSSTASVTVDMSSLTPRFNTLDTAVASANTSIANVKTKTDQLTFGTTGVVTQPVTTTVDLSSVTTALTTLDAKVTTTQQLISALTKAVNFIKNMIV